MRPPRLRAVFNFSGSEIVFLLLLALIVLGPEKLPDAIRKFAKTYGEFKKVTTGFQSELKQVLDEPMREMRETADAFKKAATLDVDTSAFTDPFGRAVSSANQRTPSPAEGAGDDASPEPGPAPVPSASDLAGNEPPLASTPAPMPERPPDTSAPPPEAPPADGPTDGVAPA